MTRGNVVILESQKILINTKVCANQSSITVHQNLCKQSLHRTPIHTLQLMGNHSICPMILQIKYLWFLIFEIFYFIQLSRFRKFISGRIYSNDNSKSNFLWHSVWNASEFPPHTSYRMLTHYSNYPTAEIYQLRNLPKVQLEQQLNLMMGFELTLSNTCISHYTINKWSFNNRACPNNLVKETKHKKNIARHRTHAIISWPWYTWYPTKVCFCILVTLCLAVTMKYDCKHCTRSWLLQASGFCKWHSFLVPVKLDAFLSFLISKSDRTRVWCRAISIIRPFHSSMLPTRTLVDFWYITD